MKQIPHPYGDVDLYMEHEGLDIRLSILKVRDFLQTIGDATISLTYANKELHDIEQEQLSNIIIRNHLRHALIDYNGCFDLILQIPWFLFRLWEDVPNYNGRKIKRNSNNWVEKAEKICDYNIVIKKLHKIEEYKVQQFLIKLKEFKKRYIDIKNDRISIRSIVNGMKHNRNIRIEEFRTPTLLKLNINGMRTDSRILEERGMYTVIEREICKIDNPSKTIAKTTQTFFGKRSEVDIEYVNGELFRGKDLIDSIYYYTLNDLYDHTTLYHNATIDLFGFLKEVLDEYIEYNPVFTGIKTNKEISFNLDPFFTISQANKALDKSTQTFINYGKYKSYKNFSNRKKYI